jgi:predicted RNase H-like HicB family nuclease
MIWHYTVIINKAEDVYIANCPELNVSSQGNTINEAKENLRIALEVFIDNFGPGDIAAEQDSLITSVGVRIPERFNQSLIDKARRMT